MHVLLQPGADSGWTSYGPSVVSATPDDPDEGGEETRKKDWRLLVLEDTGELLQPDAKAVIGQGLAASSTSSTGSSAGVCESSCS